MTTDTLPGPTGPTPAGAGSTRYLEAADHAEIFVPHACPEQVVDLGEIRMNYAVAGDPGLPPLLLVPAQTESWWGYEAAMALLSDRFRVYAVDLRGQGRSTWTPGRYSVDLFGGDLVRFLDRVVQRPAVVCGLSSGGVVAAWLAAFAAPGQIRAAVLEDAPLFASQTEPEVGHSIRQGVGPLFRLWHRWLGPQWSIGDFAGMRRAMAEELPAWMTAALARMAPAGAEGAPGEPPQDLREYDPEWGDAFVSGRATLNCDHASMLRQVKVPVLFTHHFHHVDPDTGNVLGAVTDLQVRRIGQLVEETGNSFTRKAFPDMPHSMHGHAPAVYARTVTEWIDSLTDDVLNSGGVELGRSVR
ncbi:alpha/beta fold hydrolase [Lentzea sp. NPDC059081]|uniref:alpha/beta fold hydrolase n=1 Tax=Lentzea sp. NPDC059081 TaxID=3346719 RepID=UPI00368A873C